MTGLPRIAASLVAPPAWKATGATTAAGMRV